MLAGCAAGGTGGFAAAGTRTAWPGRARAEGDDCPKVGTEAVRVIAGCTGLGVGVGVVVGISLLGTMVMPVGCEGTSVGAETVRDREGGG